MFNIGYILNVHDKPNIHVVYNLYRLLCIDAENGETNWASNVRDLLFNLGLNYLWLDQNNINVSYEFLKCRTKDQYFQNWHECASDCEKLGLYKSYKLCF